MEILDIDLVLSVEVCIYQIYPTIDLTLIATSICTLLEAKMSKRDVRSVYLGHVLSSSTDGFKTWLYRRAVVAATNFSHKGPNVM